MVDSHMPAIVPCILPNMLAFADLPDSGPEINGVKPVYSPDDILIANCSSNNSLPAASLNWYIDGEEATQEMLTAYPVLSNDVGRKTSILGLR